MRRQRKNREAAQERAADETLEAPLPFIARRLFKHAPQADSSQDAPWSESAQKDQGGKIKKSPGNRARTTHRVRDQLAPEHHIDQWLPDSPVRQREPAACDPQHNNYPDRMP